MSQLTGIIISTISLTAVSGYINRFTTINILEEGTTWFRKVLRGGLYCIDKSINSGATWELDLVQLHPDEDSIIILIDDGLEGHREVVRDGAYCIDEELTSLGFSGIEDTDWENIFKTNTP